MDGPRCARGFDWAMAAGLERSCIRPFGAVHDRGPRWVSRIGFPSMATRLAGAMTERIFPTQVLTILPSPALRLLAQLPFDRSKETRTSPASRSALYAVASRRGA
jgi:hypothetical protein